MLFLELSILHPAYSQIHIKLNWKISGQASCEGQGSFGAVCGIVYSVTSLFGICHSKHVTDYTFSAPTLLIKINFDSALHFFVTTLLCGIAVDKVVIRVANIT